MDFFWMKKPDKEKTEHEGRTAASRAGFYTSTFWKMRVRQKRSSNPICEHCEGNGLIVPVNVIDHIKSVPVACSTLSEFTQHSALENLMSLCDHRGNNCHQKKTNADRYGKPFLSKAQMRDNMKKFEE